MAKDLTGTNIYAQKEALFNKVVHLVRVVRDHPDTGESILYIGSASGAYVLNGNTYLDRIMPNGLGDFSSSIPPGGGIANISEWTLDLQNIEHFVGGAGRYSDMLDSYFLENDEIFYDMIFVTGSETEADILNIFSGHIQESPNNTTTFSISAKDGTRSTLKAIPQDVTDLVEFINLPTNKREKPIPWAFGNLNVEPFNTSGNRARLAPCLCVDGLLQKYTSGRLNKTYGQPYTFYRSAGYYGKINDFTQTGEFFTIDSSERDTQIPLMRALATNDVADWVNVIDGDHSTGAVIANSDNLDLQSRGCPKLGTVSTLSVEIVATGGFNYTIQKSGETDITGSGSGDTSINLHSSWDFSSNWDFEQIKVLIDGTGAATVYEIYLALTFLEQETGDRLAFPVFQSVVGYEDLAARYPDGGVINSANVALTNPLDCLVAFCRDDRTGMRMPIAQIHTANLATERAKISNWIWDFSLTSEISPDDLGNPDNGIVQQGKIRMYRAFDGKWKFKVFDKTENPVAYFSHRWNINNVDANAPANETETTLRHYQTPMGDIHNEFIIYYGWDEALGEYTQSEIASPYYTVTGTGTLDKTAGTLTDPSATFITKNIQVGHKCFVARDKLYVVDAVVSETVIEVSPFDVLDQISDGHSDEYWIGPNFDFNCFRSTLKYKLTRRKTLRSKQIQDRDTALNLLEYYVEDLTERRSMVKFRTGVNAVDLENTDFIIVDHPDLPGKKRPAVLGTLDGAINDSVTALPMVGTGAQLAQENDILIIRAVDSPALPRKYHEVVFATGTDSENGEIDVTRAEVGTVARDWEAGDEVMRAITKFEIVGFDYLGNNTEVEITAKETPRNYTRIAHYAPEDIGRYEDSTAEEQARYAYYSHPNKESSWLDPDSVTAIYAPEPA